MATEGWSEYQLEELIDVKHGFAFPGNGITDVPTKDVLVTPGNFAIGGGFKGDKFKFFHGEFPDEYILRTDDLIVSMTDLSKTSDTLGYPALVPDIDGLRMLHNQRIGKVLIKAGAPIQKGFLYYLLCTKEYRQEVLASASGSTVKHTSPGRIRAFKTTIPEEDTQRAIASVLGALDDKIELNRRMNATLEAMAQAVFKEWFLDRAKEELPDGWQQGELSQFFEYGIGGIWGVDEPTEKASIAARCLRGIDCHALAERNIPEAPLRFVSEKQLKDRVVKPGVILFEGSGSFCGRSLCWVSPYDKLFHEPVVYSNFCKRLDPLVTEAQAMVIWMQVKAAYATGELSGFRTGTAFPNFDVKGMLSSWVVTCPSEEDAERYLQLYKTLLRLDLIEQSRNLAALRDTLLPKLMRGEVRVKVREQARKLNTDEILKP